jgi:predicted nucleic acid-binding protein
MEIVVDTNILISALLREGLTRKIILLSPFDMYTLAFAEEEIQKHKAELINKSKLTDEQFGYLIQLIFGRMSLVPLQDIEPFRDRAIGIMLDIDIADSHSWHWPCCLMLLSGAMTLISRDKMPPRS